MINLKDNTPSIGNEVINQGIEQFEKLAPFYGSKRYAIDYLRKQIEDSNLAIDLKEQALWNIKKLHKYFKNQCDITDIAIQLAKPGTDFSNHSSVNEDWLDRFMDSAKFVTNEEMQRVWGKILAGEFEHPGKTPTNIIRILSEITAELATTFSNICSLVIDFYSYDVNSKQLIQLSERNNIYLYLSDEPKKYYEEFGINNHVINELVSLNLVSLNIYGDSYSVENSKTKKLLMTSPSCFKNNQFYELQVSRRPGFNNLKKSVPNSSISLTVSGKYLKKLFNYPSNEEYLEYMEKYFNSFIYSTVPFSIENFKIEGDSNE